eukprot:3131298-Pyramimonas_sp.AAC.1
MPSDLRLSLFRLLCSPFSIGHCCAQTIPSSLRLFGPRPEVATCRRDHNPWSRTSTATVV